MTGPIALPEDGPEGDMWRELLDIATRTVDDWTIVGALMVSLHARAGGLTLPRLTKDIDTVVEVRGVRDGSRSFATLLTGLGWDIPVDTVGSDGIAAATRSNGGRDATRHRDDLALLCCLVNEPQALRDRTSQKDRRRIRGAGEPSWRVAPPDLVQDGRAAHEILTR